MNPAVRAGPVARGYRLRGTLRPAGESAAAALAVVGLSAVVSAFLLLFLCMVVFAAAVAVFAVALIVVEAAGGAVRSGVERVRGLFQRPGRYGGSGPDRKTA